MICGCIKGQMSKVQPHIPHHHSKAWVTPHNEWKDLLYQVCLNPKPARGSHLSRGGRLHLHLLAILRCLCVSASAHIYICSLAACAVSVFVYVSAYVLEQV